MKAFIQKLGMLAAMLSAFLSASAYDFKVDGIYYITDPEAKEVEVTYNDTNYPTYSGDIVVPSSVSYNGVQYSVTSIGNMAFYQCSNLTSITIPNSVTSIGNYAFYNCKSLTSMTSFAVTPPECGENIYDFIDMQKCILNVPDGCIEAYQQAPEWQNFKLIEVIGANGYCFEVDGIHYKISDSVAKFVEVTYKNSTPKYSGDIVVPASVSYVGVQYSVTSIGEGAFSMCSNLTSITIPNSVTSIEKEAFYTCSSLTSITIPNSVTSIGNWAFDGCSNLISITIPNSVTSIGSGAFYDCSSLTSITIPNSVTSIEVQAFFGCSSLTSITIPNSVTSIEVQAFFGCSSLTSITIPNSVTTIGDKAFYNCTHLKSLILGTALNHIGSEAFSQGDGYQSSSYTIPKVIWLGNTPPEGADGVEAMRHYVSTDKFTFSNQKVYPFLSSRFEVDGVIYVPVSPAERTCDVIDCNYASPSGDIVIDGTVSNRGVQLAVLDVNDYAFYDNDSIIGLKISNNGPVGNYAFSNCDALASVTASNNGSIGDDAFSCTALQELVIPDNISGLGANAFSGCQSLKGVTIGRGINSLPQGIFQDCASLESIIIPWQIKSIGDEAFDGCTSLSDVTFESLPNDVDKQTPGTSLSLGSNGSSPLFASCPLDEVYIGRKLSYKTEEGYGYSPFYRNTSLRAVKITDDETFIYDNEFYGCSNLQLFECGDGVTKIGNRAFSGCSAMTSYSSGSNVESIGDDAFSDCTGLTSFTSHAATPPLCGNQALDDINKWECTLHVPAESMDDYQQAAQWKEFFFVEEMEAVSVTEIRLNETAVNMTENATFQLMAIVLPANATNKALQWESSDASCVTVDANGLLTAIAQGTATITVRSADGNAEATCTVTVQPILVAEIRLNESEVTIKEGETYQLTAEVLPANATNKALQWESSEASCVTVDAKGLLTAIAQGTATITVRSADGNAEATCTVTVSPESGIKSVEADTATVEVFNLTGVKVADSLEGLPTGIYLVRKGSTVSKLVVR